jgi:hypothetical protein
MLGCPMHDSLTVMHGMNTTRIPTQAAVAFAPEVGPGFSPDIQATPTKDLPSHPNLASETCDAPRQPIALSSP